MLNNYPNLKDSSKKSLKAHNYTLNGLSWVCKLLTITVFLIHSQLCNIL